MKSMRVVIINRHRDDALGGSEIQCDIVARELLKRGHQVVYIAVNGLCDHSDSPYRIVDVPAGGREIAEAALSAEPDIVYWRFGKACFRDTVKRVSKRNIPFVFAVSCITDVTFFPDFDRLKLFSSTYGACKRIIRSVWNHQGFAHINALVSLNPDYVGKVRTPMQTFIPNSMPVNQEAFSWPRPYVAWVSNIKARKRPEVCLALARVVAPYGIDVLMVGKIQQKRYERVMEPESLPSNLYYLGPKSVEEVNGILASSVLLIHTCMPEGFGNNFIQAWLQGKPTVTLDFDPGGLIEKLGFGLVSRCDQQQFENNVLEVIKNPTAAAEMGRKAQVWALAQCQPERNIERLISFLEDVINRNAQVNGELLQRSSA